MAKKGTSSTKGASVKRTFVLDTNVLLSDPKAIDHFDEHDIVIPAIVIEELDNFKEGDSIINANAREFTRNVSALIKENKCTTTLKIPLGKGKGELTIDEWDPSDKDLALSMFPEVKNDNLIIAAAKRYIDKGFDVTLVSKDMMLRTKALNRKIHAEDYTHDSIKNVGMLEANITQIDPDEVEERDPTKEYYLNQPLITKDKPDVIYIWNGQSPQLVSTHSCRIDDVEIKPRGKEQRFAMHILRDPEIKAVAITGAAGSGKTLLALSAALELKKKSRYARIFVSRVPVDLGNKDMGALPGDIDEKHAPYFAPFIDASRCLMGDSGISSSENQVREWMKNKGIEMVYTSVIRGRTLNDAIIIIDEAQNTDILEMKTIVSRVGDRSKIILVGDINQIDRRWLTKESNGLSHVISAFSGQDCFASIRLPKSERSRLAELADKLL